MREVNFEDWLQIQHYRPSTQKTLKSLHQRLKNYLNQAGQSLNQKALMGFVHWVLAQGYSQGYQYQLYWAVQRYLDYLLQVKAEKLKLHLPKLKRKESQRRKALNVQELLLIENWLTQEKSSPTNSLDQLLWQLFYGLGLRRTEVCKLKLIDVQYRQKLLKVKSLKGATVRYLPLSDKQIKCIQHYIDKARPSPQKGMEWHLILSKRGYYAHNYLGRRLIYWQEKTGLDNRLCWHILRHTVASQLAQKGMEIKLISQFLGHSGLASTAHYLHYKT